MSPDTARARPRSKRLTIRRLEFGNGIVAMSLFHMIYMHLAIITIEPTTKATPAQSAHTLPLTPILRPPLSDLSTLLNCELPPTLQTVSEPLPLQGNIN